MKKTELIDAIASTTDSSQAATSEFLNAFIATVTKELKKGEDVTITGFGSFKVSERAARPGRNPSTGETMDIAASKAVRFSAGAVLKSEVNAA